MKILVKRINRQVQVVRVGKQGKPGPTGPQGPKGDQGDPATNLMQSVNGKQGAVVLNATDIGADPAGSASQALQDAKDYTDSEVSTLDSSLATVAKTGSYNDLSNKPTIPSIAGLATEQYVDNGLATKVDKEVGKGLSANDYTTLEKNKLAGIANNATANQTDSYLLNRTNHTGTQAQSTVTNLTTDLAAKANASDTVNLTGNQTIAGVKTFSSSPVVPTATTGAQAVNKAQMDAADALKVNKAGDTMTGELTVPTIKASIAYDSTGIGVNMRTQGDTRFFYNSSGITPTTHNSYDLGTASLAYKKVYSVISNINGVDYMSGVGFPNGVVSAPVGSTYIDTAATNGITHWLKLSGSGNTGYVPQNLSSTVPATATAIGVAGQQAYDTNYLYICTATNTWKRVAIASW